MRRGTNLNMQQNNQGPSTGNQLMNLKNREIVGFHFSTIYTIILRAAANHKWRSVVLPSFTDGLGESHKSSPTTLSIFGQCGQPS